MNSSTFSYKNIEEIDTLLAPLVNSEEGVDTLCREFGPLWAYAMAFMAPLPPPKDDLEANLRAATGFMLGVLTGLLYVKRFGFPEEAVNRIFRVAEIGEE